MKVEAEQTQTVLNQQKQRIDLLTQEKKDLQLILQDFYSDQQDKQKLEAFANEQKVQ